MKFYSLTVNYFNQVMGEIQKVSFPTLNQTVKRAALVVVSIIIGTIFLALVDGAITQLVKLFILK